MQVSCQFTRSAQQHAIAFAVTLVVTCFASLSATAQANKKELKERILFVSNRDNPEVYAIYSMNPDGSKQTRLSKGEGIIFDPTWSPDHKQILFSRVVSKDTRSSALCIMKPDGSDVTIVAPAEEETLHVSPSWSPDGKHIAYSAVNTGADSINGSVYTMDSDGKNRKKVIDGVVPVWAPDSKRLLFCPVPTSGVPELKIVNIDGTNVKTLAAKGFGPAWSPDGKRIAFASDHEGHPAVFVMDADGSHSTQLTKGSDILAVGPVWTVDGKHILYTQLPKDGGDTRPRTSVWIMDADGGNAKALTKEDSFLGTGTSMIFVMRSARKS